MNDTAVQSNLMLRCKRKCGHQITDSHYKAARYPKPPHRVHFQLEALQGRSIRKLTFQVSLNLYHYRQFLTFLYQMYSDYYTNLLHKINFRQYERRIANTAVETNYFQALCVIQCCLIFFFCEYLFVMCSVIAVFGGIMFTTDRRQTEPAGTSQCRIHCARWNMVQEFFRNIS